MDIDAEIPVRPRRHGRLWFTDGSVVIATDEFLFRVHKSVLSMQSSVFKDMFDLSSDNVQGSGGRGSGIAPEMYEELPLVTLAGDKGRDVAHLLNAVYDRSYYDKENDVTLLEVILALLTLSTKYDFELIKRDVITHLRSIYPDTLNEYDDNENIYNRFTHVREPLFGADSKLDCDIALLQAAFSNDIEIILPALFYSCCTSSTVKLPTILLRHPDLLTRNKECGERLVSGHERLSAQYHHIARIFIEGCARCASDHVKSLDVDMYGLEYLMDAAHAPFTRSDLVTYFGNGVQICEACKRALLARVESEREGLWAEIPDIFGLPSWRILRERYDA